jgi:cytoskeleton protein RodZ
MSEAVPPEPTALELERSPGVLIRKAREQRGLHIAALAASMKVTPRKLEALEGDRWDELPDATFVRALAQSVCRTLKVDPKPVLDLLPPAAPAMREVPARNLNTAYSGTPSREAGSNGETSMRPLVIAAALLAVAAAVMFALPASVWNGGSPAASAAQTGNVVEPAASAASTLEPAAVNAPARSGGGAITAAGTAVPSSASLVQGGAGAPVLAGAAVLESAASEPAGAATGAAAGTAAGVAALALQTLGPPGASASAAVGLTTELAGGAASAAAGVVLPYRPSAALQLRARKSSWVTVKDMRNRMVFDRQVPAGGRVGLDGEAPLSVVVGNAAGVEMSYKGKTVDLLARARGNVARIDLP